jgi:hypothetical protein
MQFFVITDEISFAPALRTAPVLVVDKSYPMITLLLCNQIENAHVCLRKYYVCWFVWVVVEVVSRFQQLGGL